MQLADPCSISRGGICFNLCSHYSLLGLQKHSDIVLHNAIEESCSFEIDAFREETEDLGGS